MSRRKTNKKPIIILLVLMVLIAALLGGMIWFVSTHFFGREKKPPCLPGICQKANCCPGRDRRI